MKGAYPALISCMFFGLSPVFLKSLLQYMTPMVLAALTSASAAAVLFFILEVRHKIYELTDLKPGQILLLAAISILTAFMAQLLYVTGLKYSSAANAVLLTRLNPLLIALMGVLFLGERITRLQIAGSLIMVFGVVLIATKNFTTAVTPEGGDLLFILATFCWAVANIIMKKYLCDLPPEVIVVGRNAFAGLLLLAITAGQIPAAVNASIIPFLFGFVFLVIIVGQYLWYYALEHTSASNVAFTALSIPVFGVFFSTTLLGETLSSHQVYGGLLIILGLVAVEMHLSALKGLECRIRSIHIHHH